MTPTQTPSEKPGEMAVDYVLRERGDGVLCIYSAHANVVIAEFAPGCRIDAYRIIERINTRAAQLPSKPSELVEFYVRERELIVRLWAIASLAFQDLPGVDEKLADALFGIYSEIKGGHLNGLQAVASKLREEGL